MTAREQLADRIVTILDRDRLWPDAQETALAAADAVIGMVVPLEWREERGTDYVIFRASSTLTKDLYSCGTDANGDSYWCFNSGPFVEIDSGGHEAAKAAANRHHRAQILAALGITQETAE